MSEDKFLKELQNKRQDNLKDLQETLARAFNLQKVENISAIKHGDHACRRINLRAKILSALCKEKVTRNNIDNLLYDFDTFDFIIHDGFFILKINNRSTKK
jgi:hypothetical protein